MCKVVIVAIVLAAAGATAGCGDVNAGLAQLAEARRLSADLLAQFVTAADAANLAVMAETDSASVAFERDAERAKQLVQRDVDELQPMLRGLNLDPELRHLQDFISRFAQYQQLDRQILDLAVENTNFKARQLSFGPAQEAAAAFADILNGLPASFAGQERCRAEALSATALAAAREIQVLQAPHIAEAQDEVMMQLEKRMAAAESRARSALTTLTTLAGPARRAGLAKATAALDRFVALNAQIVELSRRNTDVRSLALSQNEKRALVNACEQALCALQEALAKRGYPHGRT